VLRLYVFGSASTDAFDPARSDVDFLVEFGPDVAYGLFGDYLSLKEALELLLGRTVDLVEAPAIRNPYFKEEAERTRVPVYGQSSR
jgi:hypothetical protein